MFKPNRIVKLADAGSLPRWQRPTSLLILFAIAMPLAFSTWVALMNNFVHEIGGFTGVELGWQQTVREIPGFLAIGVIAIIIFVREQVLAIISLLMLAVAVMATAQFTTFTGILLTTVISSIGFHYFETVNQSLQLQWIEKKKAPEILGWLVAVGSAVSLLIYGFLVVSWKSFGLSYNFVYMVGGGLSLLVILIAWVGYPQFESPHPQVKKMILKRRYWLYYALQFMSGARRQIFVVFAAFMMVEHFGFEVHDVTALFLINYIANMVFAPIMGKMINRFGERTALTFEYVGLTIVFLLYGGIFYFGWGVVLAAALYILDHLFFALAFALKTYFQKIADPADIAPTAAVAFTINHIAAVFLPASLGYLWIVSPASVFVLAAGMAITSLCLSLMIPRHPEPGNETVFSRLKSFA